MANSLMPLIPHFLRQAAAASHEIVCVLDTSLCRHITVTCDHAPVHLVVQLLLVALGPDGLPGGLHENLGFGRGTHAQKNVQPAGSSKPAKLNLLACGVLFALLAPSCTRLVNALPNEVPRPCCPMLLGHTIQDSSCSC